jgi:hypothetical protein
MILILAAQKQDAAQRLEHSLRPLFLRALENREFAQELEDKKILEQKYPVSNK